MYLSSLHIDAYIFALISLIIFYVLLFFSLITYPFVLVHISLHSLFFLLSNDLSFVQLSILFISFLIVFINFIHFIYLYNFRMNFILIKIIISFSQFYYSIVFVSYLNYNSTLSLYFIPPFTRPNLPFSFLFISRFDRNILLSPIRSPTLQIFGHFFSPNFSVSTFNRFFSSHTPLLTSLLIDLTDNDITVAF